MPTRTRSVRLAVLLIAFILGVACSPIQAPTLAGDWAGHIDIGGVQAPIQLHFAIDSHGLTGLLTFPEQGIVDVPLTILTDTPPDLVFSAFEGPGMAIFSGARLDANTIRGDFSQAGAAGSFSLSRMTVATADPLPYHSEDLFFTSGDITLGGTLTLPFGPGPFPALVLLTGAGPQTRDNELFGYRPFALLADHLARQGYAVLRYDDRGVGASGGDLASAVLDDLVDDALAALAYLRQRSEIDAARIGLLGHSEGALVAPLAATREEGARFLVLLAAPTVPMDQLVLRQTELALQDAGLDVDAIASSIDLERRAQLAVREGGDWEALEAEYAALRLAQLEGLLAEAEEKLDLEALAQDMAVAWGAGYRSSGWRSLLDHDPAATLAQVRVPVLAIYGTLDTQTEPAQNVPPLNDALSAAGVAYTLVSIGGANHGLQPAVTGSVGEMPGLPKHFAPGVLDAIGDWLATTN